MFLQHFHCKEMKLKLTTATIITLKCWYRFSINFLFVFSSFIFIAVLFNGRFFVTVVNRMTKKKKNTKTADDSSFFIRKVPEKKNTYKKTRKIKWKIKYQSTLEAWTCLSFSTIFIYFYVLHIVYVRWCWYGQTNGRQ